MPTIKSILVFIISFGACLSLPAQAYLGPGFGIGAIASLLALGSAFFITVFQFIWLPIKRLLFTSSSDEEDSNNENASKPSDAEEDSTGDK